MHIKRLLPAVLLALPFSAFAQLGFNLSGFSTQYSEGNIDAQQTYMVLPSGTVPQGYNGAWISVPVTNAGGNPVPYMLVNGGLGTANVWSESLDVAGSNETFSFLGTSVYSGDTGSEAATMQLMVDGNAVGGINTLYYNAANPGQLSSFSVNLGSLSTGLHSFALVDTNSAYTGNDFALAAATPEPSAFAVLGLGIIPILRRRKRS